MRSLIVVSALLSVLISCSSAPAAPEAVQDRKNRAADYLKFGRQSMQEAQYQQALSFFQVAADLDTAVDYEAGMAAAWNLIATAHGALGNAKEEEAALARAEALAAAVGDKTLIRQVAANRAQALMGAGKTEEAGTLLQALRPFGSKAEGAALYHAWGIYAKAVGNTTDAIAAFKKALQYNTDLKLKQEMASNHFMIASVLAGLSRWPEAQAELLLALELDKTMENTVGIGLDLRALGTVALKQGQNDKAVEWYTRAYRVFTAAGLADQQKKTQELLKDLGSTVQ